ncbi:MAG TPA: DUF362 domain-containing protein, partial [Armatimonadota bacterium]
GVSLALKNLKGLLVREEKRRFHETGLNGAIVDLCNTIKPHLNIIDGISCMERMGPHGGDVVDLNLLIAGEDRAEVDYVGCQVMGYELSEVAHVQKYADMNGIDLSAVEVVGESIESVKYPFKKVEMQKIIPAEFRVHDTNACCTCMNAFLISCRFLGGKLSQSVDVYMGTVSELPTASDALSVSFGNCCAKSMTADKVVRGCPPYPFDLGRTLKEIVEEN